MAVSEYVVVVNPKPHPDEGATAFIYPTGVGKVDTNPPPDDAVLFVNVDPGGAFVCETFVSVVGNT